MGRCKTSRFAASLMAALGLAAAPVPPAAAGLFMGLGDLPGGSFSSAAFGVSADGSVVVGFSESATGRSAFRWTQEGGMVALSASGFSAANGVSADGSVVVGSTNCVSNCKAFRWTEVGGMVELGDLPGGHFYSKANAVSADGSVVVGVGNSVLGWEAFRWTEGGGMVGLGDLPGGDFYSEANAVSADGSVVVGRGESVWVTLGASYSQAEAFRWTQVGGFQGLGYLPGGSALSSALGVSADGSVVVGFSYSASGTEAFRWTETGGMVGLGDFPGGLFHSAALGVSADGSVVVGYGHSVLHWEAFIWDAVNGMRNLREVLVNDLGLGAALAGWTLWEARGISADGLRIVGWGINPDGQTEAWLADLSPSRVPEPATAVLVGSGVALLVVASRRQRNPRGRRERST